MTEEKLKWFLNKIPIDLEFWLDFLLIWLMLMGLVFGILVIL